MSSIDVAAYLQRGRQAVKDGEYELAARYFNQILSAYPDNAEARQGLESIDIERARRSRSPVGYYLGLGRGLLMNAMGKSDSAYQSLKFLHLVNPKNAQAALGLARSAARLDKLEEAHAAYSAALKLTPSHQGALREDAEVLVKLDRHEEASERLKRLHALRPNDDKIEHRMRDVSAMAYSKVGIPEDLKARRREMEKEKKEQLDSGAFMEKLNALLEAYKADHDNHQIGVSVANHYLSGGHLKQASKVLALILDKDENFAPAKRAQARVWRRTGELDICVGLYEELHQAKPDDLELKGEYLDACIAQLEAKRVSGDLSKDDFSRLETLKIELEKNRIAFLQALLKDRPESHDERAELGDLLLKHGRTQEAISSLQRLLSEPSYAGRGYFLLGQCFRAQNDLPLAVQQYEKALEYVKNKGYSHVPTAELKEIYYNLGLALEQLGDKKGAREAYGNIYSYDINYRDVKQRYESSLSGAAPK